MKKSNIEMIPRDDANYDHENAARREMYKEQLAKERKDLQNKPLPKPKPPEQPVMDGF